MAYHGIALVGERSHFQDQWPFPGLFPLTNVLRKKRIVNSIQQPHGIQMPSNTGFQPSFGSTPSTVIQPPAEFSPDDTDPLGLTEQVLAPQMATPVPVYGGGVTSAPFQMPTMQQTNPMTGSQTNLMPGMPATDPQPWVSNPMPHTNPMPERSGAPEPGMPNTNQIPATANPMQPVDPMPAGPGVPQLGMQDTPPMSAMANPMPKMNPIPGIGATEEFDAPEINPMPAGQGTRKAEATSEKPHHADAPSYKTMPGQEIERITEINKKLMDEFNELDAETKHQQKLQDSIKELLKEKDKLMTNLAEENNQQKEH